MSWLRQGCLLRLVACGVLALAMTGCFGKKDDLSELGGDMVGSLDPLSDDISLAPRGEFGTPVTDVSFENVAFPYDSFQIADSERRKVEAVSDYMLSNSDVTVVIDGHCDERGSREYNLSLGEHRALAIRAYLISLGVSADKVQTRSFGEEQPLVPGHDEGALSQNRRGEFSLFR
jgi:peptidoglycan-associated lipoprotein